MPGAGSGPGTGIRVGTGSAGPGPAADSVIEAPEPGTRYPVPDAAVLARVDRRDDLRPAAVPRRAPDAPGAAVVAVDAAGVLGAAPHRAAGTHSRRRADRRVRARAVPQLHLLRHLPGDDAGARRRRCCCWLASERRSRASLVRWSSAPSSARRRCWRTRRRTGPTSRSSAIAPPTISSAGAPRQAASSRPLPTAGCTAGPRTTADPEGACGRASSPCCCARSGSGPRGASAATWMYGAMLVVVDRCSRWARTRLLYRVALVVVPPLQGLRAPARFGMMVALALVGAGGPRCRMGARRDAAGLAAARRRRGDARRCWPASTRPTWGRCSRGYSACRSTPRGCATQPPGVVVDLPIARAKSLPLLRGGVDLLRAHARAPDGQRLQRLLSRGATSICSAR